ncbi:MAG TPA: hypothetical protein VFB21_03645 [Chthonomonadaceae bacterium]|nr:hypothetical protein [Chthonomonadaceae bacterium]
MAYTRFKTVNFGSAKGGLTTVGYQLFNADGTANGARITTGVTERGANTGLYGASVSFPDGFQGELRWDTGGSSPATASEEINPTPFEKALLDLAQAVPTSNTAQTVGDALNAARAQGFGKWALNPLANPPTLALYAADGTTVVRSFTLNDPTSPTTRT